MAFPTIAIRSGVAVIVAAWSILHLQEKEDIIDEWQVSRFV